MKRKVRVWKAWGLEGLGRDVMTWMGDVEYVTCIFLVLGKGWVEGSEDVEWTTPKGERVFAIEVLRRRIERERFYRGCIIQRGAGYGWLWRYSRMEGLG